MQPNDNYFPPELLQWVESTPYAALSPQQQHIVADYCSKAEYAAMQQSYQLLAAQLPQQQPKIQPLHKQQLLAQYATTYPPKPSIALPLWRAAAVVLFFISFGLGYQYHSMPNIVKTNIIRDTLYLSRQVAAGSTTIHDAIYQHIAPKPATSNAYLASTKTPKPTASTKSNPDLVHIVAVQSINQTVNLSRNSSIKNDEMIQEFQFVSL